MAIVLTTAKIIADKKIQNIVLLGIVFLDLSSTIF